MSSKSDINVSSLYEVAADDSTLRPWLINICKKLKLYAENSSKLVFGNACTLQRLANSVNRL